MIDRRRMGRSRSRSPDQAAENYAAVATSITYAAFVLRIITGLVVCAVMLSTASFVMNGLNLREKKETRQQLMQEVLETRLLIYDLKRIADQQKRKSEEIFDEVLRVKDGIKDVKKEADIHQAQDEESRKKISNNINEFKDEIHEKLKAVEKDREDKHISIQEMLADERKELEEILERQERRSSSSMEVLTKRMFFQFDATHRYIVQRVNSITSYLSIVSQGQNKLMMSNFKDVLSKVFVTYERMKSTYLDKSKEQTTTLSYRIKDNLILMRSEMNSIFNYMSSAIEGTRRSLRTELTSEIVSGNKGTVAYMSTAWHGLRNNLNTLGIVNKKYHQSSIERMKIDVKILQSKLNAQTGDVGAMIRENRRLMEYLFEDQSRVNYKHHADQSTFIDAGIQTIFRSIENSAADVKSEAKKDAKEAKDEVLEKIEERTYFLKKELMASRTQVGQKIIGLNEDLTKVITDHRTAIEQKVTDLTTLVTNEVANIKTKIGDEKRENLNYPYHWGFVQKELF